MLHVLLRYLAMVSTNQLNYFPVKGGVSKYHSLHMLMKQHNLNYKKDCAIPFGTYMQGNKENNTTNNNHLRLMAGIYLRPTNDKQSSHEIMNLATGAVVTCARVWEIPITPLIIKAAEDMAEKRESKP